MRNREQTSYGRYEVFLSHNSADKLAVEELARRLAEEVGLRPFLDKWHLIPGEPWQESLEEALEQSATVAVFIGPSGVSPWHNEEMRTALDNAVRTRDEYRVIPVLLPGASHESVTGFLARRTWVDFRSGLDDAEAFQRLVAGVKGEAIDSGAYQLPDEPAPYRGLLPFKAEHAEFFFGREDDTWCLIEKLRHDAFVAVIGASGSGKSSLMRAGLLPTLAKDAFPDSNQWPTLVLTPGGQPLRALAEGLATFVPPADRLRVADELADRLATRADGLRTAVTTLLADAEQPLLLVIDQFEEIFTLCQDDPERCHDQAEQFIANLGDTAGREDRRILILITLRADFLDRCLAFPQLKDLLQDRQMLLGALDEPALRDAIVRPAQAVGAYFEKGLVGTILRDVQAQPGALPLLQHALYELWRARRGPWLALDAYEASGGVSGALQRRAQATYDALTPEQQGIARNVFLRLTALGEGVSDTRRRVSRSELYPAGVDPGQVDAVLEKLSGPQARLIIADEQTVEVAHEALIQQWSTLREWLEEDRAGLRVHRRLTESAIEWQRNSRDESYLYQGARLAEAEEWEKNHTGDLNPLEGEFLETSVEGREIGRLASRRRAQRIIAGLVAGLVIISALAIFAWWQGQIARCRELAASAVSQLSVDPELSMILALQAVSETCVLSREARTEALEALHQAVQASHVQLTLPGHNGSVTDVAFSPDGKFVATAGVDWTARMWDAESGKELITISGHSEAVNSVAFSPDGMHLATASSDKTVKLWDATSGVLLLTISAHDDSVRDITFSPDGTRLATASDDKSAKIWDATSGQELLTLSGHRARVKALAFSPDGTRLATASDDETAKIWDARSGEELLTLFGHNYLVSGVAFSPDGSRLATASDDSTAKLWDTVSGQELLTLAGHTNAVFEVAFSPDGARLATASVDGTAKVWDLSSGRELFALLGHKNPLNSVIFSPDGMRLATASVDGTAKVWDVSFSHTSPVSSIAFSPDGMLLATASDDRTVKIWDAVSGEELRTIADRHTHPVKGVAFSPDGMRLATVSDDRTVKVWDAASYTVVLTLSGHRHGVNSAAFSPNGKRLVTASDDNTVKVWDTESGEELRTFSDFTNWVASVAISPDGKRLATAAGDGIKVMEVASKPVLLNLSQDEVYDVVFSPDGKRLATAHLNNMARVWDAASGEQLFTLSGHTNAVFGIAFSPDGKRLATASWDKTAKVWDATSGQELFTLSHSAEVYDVAFSPDGTRLATACADGRGHIYLLDVEELIALARTRITRSLTPAECQKYLHREQCPPML